MIIETTTIPGSFLSDGTFAPDKNMPIETRSVGGGVSPPNTQLPKKGLLIETGQLLKTPKSIDNPFKLGFCRIN
jgi:hypothetical protein